MGASEGSEGGIGAGECGVGTIVWVRRRNGSWWPGRILGQDELSASHLMSPRSGTPVKLLGREDASVDWYNLEKSKRVKSFRCGEFDSCIERAEASQGAPIKKREKYARREDAILHALELEKQMIERRKQKFGSNSVKQNAVFSSGNHLKNNESANHGRFVPKSQLLSRKVGSSETGISSPFYSQKGGKRSIWEAGTSETLPRMRGLQDFGLRSAHSKKKDDASLGNECTHNSFLVESHGRAFPGSMQGMEGIPNVISSKNYLPLKKRRAQGGLNEEFLTKRRDRRRPLVQVLQSSAKLSSSQSLPTNDDSVSGNMQVEGDHAITIFNVERPTSDNPPDDSNTSLDHVGYSSDQMQISPVLRRCPVGTLVEENTSSGFNEADDSDSAEEACSDEDADTEDDGFLYQGYTQPMPSVTKKIGRYVEDDSLISFPDQDNDESFLSGYRYPQMPQYHRRQTAGISSDLGVSKWNMKGKRNIRNLTKRQMESMDEMPNHIYRRSINGSPYESKRRTMKSSRGRVIRERFYQKYDSINGSDFIEVDLNPQSASYRKHKFSSILKGSSGYQRDGDINDSDEEPPDMSPSRWEAEGDQFDQYYARHISGGIEWVDIDLKVQASYQGERVPLVSLMSRMNGKAIIGHPVQIETLEDGSTNELIIRNDSLEDHDSIEGNETPPTVWRTGRRTAMQRVPHPHPLPAALKNKEAESVLYSDPENKPPFKKPYAVHLDNQTGLTKKSLNSHRAMKNQKKPSKKASLSNQKVRKLSSFATQQKLGRGQGMDGKLANKDVSILDDLITIRSSVPMVTCVPVKVVCSRILEAVGRSPSAVTTQRVLLSATSENNLHD